LSESRSLRKLFPRYRWVSYLYRRGIGPSRSFRLLLTNLFEANSNFFRPGRAGKFARDLMPQSLSDRCVQFVNLSKKALSSGVSSNSDRPSNIKF